MKPLPDSFAEAIEKTLSDERYYARLKEGCVKRSREILAAKEYCEILVEKYEELIKGNGGKL